MSEINYRTRVTDRWNQLKAERESWVPHWQELSRHVQPRLGQYLATDTNKGQKRHNSIYDSTGTRALRVLSAGMMAGMTSPARPWFRLGTQDPDLAEHHSVKMWLADVRRLMLDIFSRSNTYRAMQTMYEELGLFGTAASIVLPNYDNVIHHYPVTVGQFALATDAEGRVNTFYREYAMRVAEIVDAFGYDACTPSTQQLYRRGALEKWITVVQAIEPRADRDPRRRDNLNMPWRSVYFELGSVNDKYLRESGFRRFRPLTPRWHTTGGDIYGYSPGMEALGDIKQLQHQQLRKAQGIDYLTKPPLQVPSILKSREVDAAPGGVTYVDAPQGGKGVQTLFETRIDLNHLLADIQDVRERINGAFYADLFLMLASQPAGGQMTATEVAERHEEKLLMLGPVLERLHDELLSPLIEGTFDDMLEAGILPPPPPELADEQVRVEFVSVLAQAQRAVGTAGLDRYVSNLGVVAQIKPDVLDKFDADKWADAYADALGVDPELIVASEDVAVIRQQRAQQMQQERMAAMANSAATTANKLGGVPTSGGQSNAASDILGLFSGYASPSAETY